MENSKSEKDIMLELKRALQAIETRGTTIDEFEKLYIITAAKSSRGTLVTDNSFREDDFEDIKTLEQYVTENGKLGAMLNSVNINESVRENENSQIELESAQDSTNCYVIPRTNSQVIRIGNMETTRDIRTYAVVDTDGYSLYTVMEDGRTLPSKILKEEISKYLESNYKQALDNESITIDDVIDYMNPGDIDRLAIFIDSNNFSLREVDKAVDSFMLGKIITDKTVDDKEIEGKDISTLEDNSLDEYADPSKQQETDENRGAVEESDKEPEVENEIDLEETLENDISEKEEEEKKRQKEEMHRAGIGDEALQKIANVNHCKIAQINIRILGTREALNYAEELTGANLRRYRGGEVMAVRIPRVIGGDKLYLANTATGERIQIRERFHENVEDAEQIFKYKWRPGLDTVQAMQKPKEKEGQITYMSYVDKNGNIKQAKYLNNGKQIDLSIEERERYLAEVMEADKILRDAIEEHEKTPTQESHLRVKDAMQKRVAVDRKYNVLEKQREVSKESIQNAKEIVEEDDGRSIDKDHDDDDDWGPWSHRR